MSATATVTLVGFLFTLFGVTLSQDALNGNKVIDAGMSAHAILGARPFVQHGMMHFGKRSGYVADSIFPGRFFPIGRPLPPQLPPAIDVASSRVVSNAFLLNPDSTAKYTASQDRSLTDDPYLQTPERIMPNNRQLVNTEGNTNEQQEMREYFNNEFRRYNNNNKNSNQYQKLVAPNEAVNSEDETVSYAKSEEELRKAPINLSTRSRDFPQTLTNEVIQKYLLGLKPQGWSLTQLNKKAETKPQKDNFFMHFG